MNNKGTIQLNGWMWIWGLGDLGTVPCCLSHK